MNYLILILGLAVLIIGGEFLVKGAVGIAKKAHISPLVIGMTVISFGTSAPELVVSIKAALSNNPEIAIGNVIGSNIANIGMVLGITVLIFPIIVDRNSKILDWPMMMLASLLFFLFAYDNTIQQWEGIVLFGILVSFTTYLIVNSRKKTKKELAEQEKDLEETAKSVHPILSIGYVLIGLVGLFFGAEWLLKSAIAIATDLGMSKSVIGVTIVAFATSVPELVTSAVAAFKKETDISIGNLIGSNLFNIMAVIGITAIIKPIPVEQSVLDSDFFWMLAIAAALLPLMLIGKKLNRFKGFLLLSSYVAYIAIVLINLK
ncbi:MAG: calcium/sodium antiporter [Crocinitomicaceae bacterium]